MYAKSDENKNRLAGLFGIFTFKKVWAAASMLLFVSLATAYLLTHSFRNHVAKETVVSEHPQKDNHPAANDLQHKNEQGMIPSYTHDKPNSDAAAVTKKSPSHRPKNPVFYDSNNPSSDIADKSKNELVQGVPLDEESDQAGQSAVVVEHSPDIENNRMKNVLPSGVAPVAVQYSFADVKDRKDNDDKRISLSGSVGKGVNSTVYAAGVNYQQSVGRGFFVEGMFAVYSSNLNNMASFENSAGKEVKVLNSNPAGSFGAEDLASNNVDAKIQTVNYAHLSLNPSLGYKLTKRISVKAGVDVQRKISSSKEALYAESDAVYKPLPGLDVGLTPKIGIKLSSHWQTTIMYRKGINDLLSRKDYFNRNFVLMQLGYAF